MYKTIQQCRICKNSNLIEILDLGVQALTGIFPNVDEKIDSCPLVLVKCFNDDSSQCCGLVQLKHTYNLQTMYGNRYGYRSSLNNSMVNHLKKYVIELNNRIANLTPDDLIVDIGSNDGTFLNSYPETHATLVGIDPTAKYFREFYSKNIEIIDDFFSASDVKAKYPKKKAKIITSFSMFYDLEEPIKFAQEIADLLDDDGVWIFEQSYLPLMLQNNSFDTICHEHLEYYSLEQINWIFKICNLKILDVRFNDVNGGSFCIYAAKNSSSQLVHTKNISQAMEAEKAQKLDQLEQFYAFADRIKSLRSELLSTIRDIQQSGKTVSGLGASTKGNVLLQYYNIDSELVKEIGEINIDKYGKVTPGSHIPIVSEESLLDKSPDYLLVLPWHFKDFFIKNPRFANSKLIFPLPLVEILSNDSMV